MELAKDNLEPATQRDVRDTQALMLAGFELCLELLGMILQTHKTGQTLTGKEMERIIRRNKQTFIDEIDQRRAKFFLNSEL